MPRGGAQAASTVRKIEGRATATRAAFALPHFYVLYEKRQAKSVKRNASDLLTLYVL
jgi:hypothetical protein